MTPLEVASIGTRTEFNKKLPILFYYHGGGFAVLCPDQFLYDKFCRRLAKSCSVVVVSVHYRCVQNTGFAKLLTPFTKF